MRGCPKGVGDLPRSSAIEISTGRTGFPHNSRHSRETGRQTGRIRCCVWGSEFHHLSNGWCSSCRACNAEVRHSSRTAEKPDALLYWFSAQLLEYSARSGKVNDDWQG